MSTTNYNGELDGFEVPADLWGAIEAALNEKEHKKRGFIWWRIAGILILVLGIASVLLYSTALPDDKRMAENTIPEVLPSNERNHSDTATVLPKEDSATNQIGADRLNSIQTAVPFLRISPDHRSGRFALNLLSGTPNSLVNGFPTSGVIANGNASTSNNSGVYNWNSTTPISATGEQDISQVLSLVPGVVLNASSSNQLYFTSPRQDASGCSYAWSATNGTVNTQQAQFGFMNSGTYNVQVSVVGKIGNKINVNSDLLLSGGYSGESWEAPNTSQYDEFVENNFIPVHAEPQSTFSIDVDGASYSDIRGMINRGEMPNKSAVRIEEFINYFPYNYPEPIDEHPFSMHSQVGSCPWNPDHLLMKIGIKGKSIQNTQLPKNNLVFLLDVSGSMNDPEKLDLLKKGFRLLVNELREEDKVAVCVYAGAAGVVLAPTSGANKDKILDALNNLSAGGSTAGGEGIELAYALAEKSFNREGNNRVILATDGDFNVGISDDDDLAELIEKKRESGVFLTVLGFGHDNFQSSKMEKLANKGNGNFSYIDNIIEAKKVLVTEMGATLLTIAKDVKIQLEFNPALVADYRLIGYENRLLQNEDFSNDSIDAGELGAGHT